MRLLACGVAALVLAGCGDRGQEQVQSRSRADTPVGTVDDLRGEVIARRAGAGEERALARGAPIYADDAVTTADDAILELRFFHNGARLLVTRASARSVADTAAYAAGAADARGVLFLDENNRPVVSETPDWAAPPPAPRSDSASPDRDP